jgi:ABC-type sugar transport system ATPase subunit
MTDQPILKRREAKSTVAVRVRNVSKSYPGVRALRGVDFELATGEVHGLVGANGAGKSTLIRMLAGAAVPDTGEIEIEGAPIAFDDPRMRRGAGIAAIYQELTIIPGMSALSNVFLGVVPSRFGMTDRRAMRRRFDELSRWMGLSIAPATQAGTLSVASQQMLEIMRAVQADQNVLIMDEPTAPLGPFERTRLYELIARLKQNGVSIIFISHDLDEVLRLCDRVSVMRDGQRIDTRKAEAWDKASLVQAMLGDVEVLPGRRRTPPAAAEILGVQGLTVPGAVSDITFSLAAGEVLGIAGLVGAGRTETLRAIAGDDPAASGRMTIDGGPVPWPRSVREAIGHGIMLAPEDRKRLGLVLSRPALVNLVLADLGAVSRYGVVDRAKRRAAATALSERLGFDPRRLDADALDLSGGNQQKLVLGKWLHRGPRILLLDEPTRGIDLGAKQEIFRTIRRLSDDGMAVILVSSDLEEVVEHADRVLVMARGRQIGELAGAEASVERILNLIFAVEDRAAAVGAPA